MTWSNTNVKNSDENWKFVIIVFTLLLFKMYNTMTLNQNGIILCYPHLQDYPIAIAISHHVIGNSWPFPLFLSAAHLVKQVNELFGITSTSNFCYRREIKVILRKLKVHWIDCLLASVFENCFRFRWYLNNWLWKLFQMVFE